MHTSAVVIHDVVHNYDLDKNRAGIILQAGNTDRVIIMINWDRIKDQIIPLILCVQMLVGSLYVLDVLDIVYYPTIHRQTHSTAFDLGWDPLLILILALLFWTVYSIRFEWRRETIFCLVPLLLSVVSTSIAVSICVFAFSILVIYKERLLGETINWGLRIIIGSQALILSHWLVFYPFNIITPFEYLVNIELSIFHIGVYLAPLMIIPFLFMWIIKPIFKGPYINDEKVKIEPESINGFLLGLSIIIAILAAIYPYFLGVNPSGDFVGVDARYYQSSLEVLNSDIQSIFQTTNGSRSFLFLVLYSFQHLFSLSTETSVKYLPIILFPLLVSASHFFSFNITNNKTTAVWSAFLTSTGLKVVVGFYSYYLANILAIILIQYSIGFLIKSTFTENKLDLYISCILGVLCLFTHPWTFVQYTSAIVIITGLTIYNKSYKKKDQKKKLKIFITYLLILLAAEFVKSVFFNGYLGIQTFNDSMIDQLGILSFWSNTIFIFRLKYGGYLSNLIILILGIIGTYSFKSDKLGKQYISYLLILTSLIFLNSSNSVMGRLLYNFPIETYASVGIYNLSSQFPEKRSLLNSSIVLFSLIYLFRSLANLV